MIPYGFYVLTVRGKDDAVAAGTVNWVTQASLAAPLVVVGVKTDSHAHPLIKEPKAFVLNVPGKDQGPTVFTFFKPATRDWQKISGEPFRWGTTDRQSWRRRTRMPKAGWWTASSAATTRSSSAK